MRLTSQSKYSQYFSKYKTILGRTYKGRCPIHDLLSNTELRTGNLRYGVEWQGWMTVFKNLNGTYTIISKRLYPIYYISKDEIGYTILKYSYGPNQLSNIQETFQGVKENKVLELLGLGFNGHIYYNDTLDLNQEELSRFRLAFDLEFDINIAKKSTGSLDYFKLKNK